MLIPTVTRSRYFSRQVTRCVDDGKLLLLLLMVMVMVVMVMTMMMMLMMMMGACTGGRGGL
jgi:hypothetical protein